MNILFVCSQNVGRSQTAAALYNSLVSDGHADSAGTKVGDEEGQTLAERAKVSNGAKEVLQVMHELGMDLSRHTRKQVRPEQLAQYDKVIVMAEPDTIPDWLRQSDKFVYWDVPDPRYLGLDAHRITLDALRRRIVELIESTSAG